MSKRESITRYNLIIKKLRKRPATFDEIADYLALESEIQEYDFNISKRTFQRDLHDIRSIHGIDILYDFSRKVYFINFDEKTEANERMLEAFDTFNALSLTDRLSKHIHFEKRKPQGTENLYGLLHAIKNCFQIKFTYQKFWEGESTERRVEPYVLKEFKNRWYVLAKDLGDDSTKTFALDRLMDLDITKKPFEFPANFDVNDYFKYSFGIIAAEGKPEKVILSFNAFQGKYVKSLPLHESQEILIDTEEELRIKLTLHTTHDFFMELLSFGENVKIIQPKKLTKRLQTTFKNVLGKYE